MARKTWTVHNLTEAQLKQLSAANNRVDGSMYPGRGNGAGLAREALFRKGLAAPTLGVIRYEGVKALEAAREEGW